MDKFLSDVALKETKENAALYFRMLLIKFGLCNKSVINLGSGVSFGKLTLPLAQHIENVGFNLVPPLK